MTAAKYNIHGSLFGGSHDNQTNSWAKRTQGRRQKRIS